MGKILVMGAGTVGIRDADVLLSMGLDVVLCKYGNYPEDANGQDIKTLELKALLERHKDKDILVFASLGPDLERREESIKKHVGKCDGSIADFVAKNSKEIKLAIDCTDGRDVDLWNFKDLYKPHNIPFAVNGGGNKTLVNRLFFAGVADSAVEYDSLTERFHDENAMIVSCNSHATITALSRVVKAVGGSEKFGLMSRGYVNLSLDRRWADPGRERGKPPRLVTLKNRPYHVSEIESLMQEITGKLRTSTRVWPVQHFHHGNLMLQFNDPISQKLLDRVKHEFQTYERAILVRGKELSDEKVINAGYWSGIDRGDFPYAVYMVDTIGEPGEANLLSIDFLTPMRGIVALPTADYVLMRTQKTTHKEAFRRVNAESKYTGVDPKRFGDSMQYSLHRNAYDKILKEKGSSPLIKK